MTDMCDTCSVMDTVTTMCLGVQAGTTQGGGPSVADRSLMYVCHKCDEDMGGCAPVAST